MHIGRLFGDLFVIAFDVFRCVFEIFQDLVEHHTRVGVFLALGMFLCQ